MNDKPKIVQLETSFTETLAHDTLAGGIESVQRMFQVDSVSYTAILGAVIGEMIAQADNNTENNFASRGTVLEDGQLEPLKQTLLMNFDATYNRVRAELEKPIVPKKEII